VDPLLARRNVVVRGFDVDSLPRGAVFNLDSGDGPVRFEVHRPANPCAWMDQVIAPGAFRALRGKGGIRCVPLDDGVLRTGKSTVGIVSA
jgi:MOSC domain-containing protein YiiM